VGERTWGGKRFRLEKPITESFGKIASVHLNLSVGIAPTGLFPERNGEVEVWRRRNVKKGDERKGKGKMPIVNGRVCQIIEKREVGQAGMGVWRYRDSRGRGKRTVRPGRIWCPRVMHKGSKWEPFRRTTSSLEGTAFVPEEPRVKQKKTRDGK